MSVSVGGEWAFSTEEQASPAVPDIKQLHFLMEGYLYMSEDKVGRTPHGVYVATPTGGSMGKAAHTTLAKRLSDSSIGGSWKRRWCVLSQTPDGVHLVYYKHQSSFASCEPPVGVVFLEGCESLYTIPTHPKSSHTLSVTLRHRTLLLYPDTEDEKQHWLTALESALNIHDSSTHLPLKGLPKHKAERKDLTGGVPQPTEGFPQLTGGVPHPHEREIPRSHGTSKRIQKEVSTDVADGEGVGVCAIISYRTLSEREVELNSKRDRSPNPQPVTFDLDSEGGPVQIKGFRTLNTD